MKKRLKSLAWNAAILTCFMWVFHTSLHLIDDAVSGWVNNVIWDWLGYKSGPTLPDVIHFIWQWVAPIITTALVLKFYHSYNFADQKLIPVYRRHQALSPNIGPLIRDTIGHDASVDEALDQNVTRKLLQQQEEKKRQPKLNVLFANNKGEPIYLRFRLDTKRRLADSLLLIIFAYKVLRNEDELSTPTLMDALKKSESIPINNKTIDFGLIQLAQQFHIATLNTYALAAELVDAGEIKRVGLSRGGFLRITILGEARARILIDETIQRA